MDYFENIGSVIHSIARRQEVNSNNVANANTPGYQAKSLSFSDVLGNLNNPFETRMSHKMGSSNIALDETSTGMPVDLQKELIEMQKNTLFYSVATRRASTIFNTLRTASQIGR